VHERYEAIEQSATILRLAPLGLKSVQQAPLLIDRICSFSHMLLKPSPPAMSGSRTDPPPQAAPVASWLASP
jgi:hypothetical protein